MEVVSLCQAQLTSLVHPVELLQSRSLFSLKNNLVLGAMLGADMTVPGTTGGPVTAAAAQFLYTRICPWHHHPVPDAFQGANHGTTFFPAVFFRRNLQSEGSSLPGQQRPAQVATGPGCGSGKGSRRAARSPAAGATCTAEWGTSAQSTRRRRASYMTLSAGAIRKVVNRST